MTFYVYKNESRKGRHAWVGQPNQWRLVGEFEQEHKAVFAAERLCPRDCDVKAEPGCGLKKALFGSTKRAYWSALITTQKL
jgi:hypothetical protein